jgi:signal transduction histidine kinase
MFLLMVWTLRPMRRLTEVVRRFAGGDAGARAEARGATEVALLAEEWNRMADRLREREAALTTQREELGRLERLATLGQVAARITHEVRNPLSSIGLNAEMLEEELEALPAAQAPEARALVRAISEEVERLRGVTEQYLRHARRSVAERTPQDLSALLRSLLDFVRAELDARDVGVELDVPPELPVLVDAPKLRQALLNLIRNAWEAMPRGGRLTVRAVSVHGEGDEPWVRIDVVDRGSGLPELALDRVFEPFFSTKERGTGLGLAVVREIVLAHGGRVSARNRPEGGAIFSVELPAGAVS